MTPAYVVAWDVLTSHGPHTTHSASFGTLERAKAHLEEIRAADESLRLTSRTNLRILDLTLPCRLLTEDLYV